MNKAKIFFIKYMPFLGFPKRFLHACFQTFLPIYKSYAQQKEDLKISAILKKINVKINKKDIFYIDVGANHPTCISNSFYFYKKGYDLDI